jgi:tRNA A37 methylthiotransferase MiaB
MKNLISLLQINNSFAGQNYLPYSSAILTSYFTHTSSASGDYKFLPFIFKRSSVNDIIVSCDNSNVLGLSLYAWNLRLSLEVARVHKERNPDALVFAGGPSVPDNAEKFLRDHPYIDIVLHNEGEIPFRMLLEEYLLCKDYSNVPSASFIRDNVFVKTVICDRIRDLTSIPSPFLNGTLDSLIKSNSTEKWIGLWETNRGCPFTCTYCDWGSATGSKSMGMFPENRLEDEMKWFSHNKIEYIFCCDANFGMFPRDPGIALMAGRIKSSTGYPHALSVQNTKNSTERSYETQKILCDYNLNKGVTLSMQTLSNDALRNIKRSNIKLSSYFELQNRFKRDGVPTYSDLILALPGETYRSFLDGMCNLIESGQHNRIQFNNLSILPNAEMARPEYIQKFGIKTVVTDIVNMHGNLSHEAESIKEKQELVIETFSLSARDWRKVRSICWLAAFLYFDKIAQIPITILNSVLGISFAQIIDKLVGLNDSYPFLSSIAIWLNAEAQKISDGGPEYIHSKEWLDIYWPADEYLFIDIVINNKVNTFYEELARFMIDLVSAESVEITTHYGKDVVSEIICESCNLNKFLLNIPGNNHPKSIKLDWNIADCYNARINGNFADISRVSNTINIKPTLNPSLYIQDWLQEVVWYGNKQGAYLRDFEIIHENNF